MADGIIELDKAASIPAAVEAIQAAQRILVTSHINPDGDALGSVLALTHALTAMGKSVVPVMHDVVPDIYRWMPGADLVQQPVAFSHPEVGFDLAIVCDAGTLDRVGKTVRPLIEAMAMVIDIDHHVADGPFGNIRILDSTVASTAELIWELLEALKATLTPSDAASLVGSDVANCLMTGVITDTGSFRYLNVTPRTFDLAAQLQRLGASPADISELVYENRSYASIKLLGRALDVLQVSEDGRIAWTHVTAQDFEDFNANDADTESIVSHVRAVSGVQVGILFREIPGKKVRISLRARDGADVNRIANVFGGGGHKLAAGCSLDPPLADVEAKVLAEAARQIATASEH